MFGLIEMSRGQVAGAKSVQELGRKWGYQTGRLYIFGGLGGDWR